MRVQQLNAHLHYHVFVAGDERRRWMLELHGLSGRILLTTPAFTNV
jgi:hypothetical protein